MIHITTHSGKLEGLHSISTSAAMNTYCTTRDKIDGSICNKCYAETYLKLRKNLRTRLEANTKELTERYISASELPIINDKYFRLESFGDIQNVTQVENYFNIAIKNHGTTFALWTKNPLIVRDAIKQSGKPVNLIIIYSSPMVNRPVKLEAIQKVFWFIDKTFTVYEKSYAAEHGIKINCGGRHCIDCLKCYKKRTTGTINELKK